MIWADMLIPRVATLIQPVVVVEDDSVSLALLSLESWTNRLVVRLCCPETDATREMDERYRRAVDAWQAKRDETGEGLPENPASRIFCDVSVAVADPAKTTYVWSDGSGPGWGGSTGIDWTVEHYFQPGVPAQVDELRIEIRTRSGSQGSVTCRLGR